MKIRVRSEIGCAPERRIWNAMQGVKRTVRLCHINGSQQYSGPEAGGANVQVIAERALGSTLRWFLGLSVACFALFAGAQNTLDNPNWVEEQVRPPPPYSKVNLIPIEMPLYVSLKIGVDPTTVTVGGDGIVRYVVVMTNSTGTINAAYEGIRCFTDEVKTYARVGSSGEWAMTSDPQWKPVNDNMPSRHTQAIARQGACDTRVAASVAEVLRALKQNSKSSKRNLEF